VSNGSLARALLESYARHTNEAYQIFDLNLARAFVSGANGRFLDFIGELLGLERLGTAAAVSNAESKAVKFYVEEGIFGDINSASDITLPAGTIISTATDAEGITYRTIVSTVLLASQSEAFLSVEAILPGASSNVGTGLLQFHDFTNYADSLNDTLKVINVGGIFTGQDIETDTNYRFRIARQVTAAEAGNLTAIRLAALSVPGVADIILTPWARGIGTYDVLIKSITPTINETLIDAVQAAINEVTARGNSGLARRPRETGMSFTIKITYRDQVTDDIKDNIEALVKDNLTNYVNGIDIGEEFIINEAVQRVMETDERIKDIGIPTKPFNDITIYRETKLQDNKIKQTLLLNYATDDDERIVIEPSLAEPIIIIRAN
jgi:uncharacterized phage protein gp47/JayE